MTVSKAKDRRVEVLAVLLMALSIFTLLSIATYNPLEEPTISEQVAIRNIMGIAGVYVSHYLIKYTLGYVSLAFPILGLLWGVWLLIKREHGPAWRLSWYGLLLALLTSMAAGLPQAPLVWEGRGDFTAGGIVGGVAAKVIYDFLGSFGSVVFLIAGYILVTSGYLRWPVREVLVRQVEKFELWWAEWRHDRARKHTRVQPKAYAKKVPSFKSWRKKGASGIDVAHRREIGKRGKSRPPVGDLHPHVLGTGDRRDDPDALGAHDPGQVIGQYGKFVHPHPFAWLNLEQRNHRPRRNPHHLPRYLEGCQSPLQFLGLAQQFVPGGPFLFHRRFRQQVDGRIPVL